LNEKKILKLIRREFKMTYKRGGPRDDKFPEFADYKLRLR